MEDPDAEDPVAELSSQLVEQRLALQDVAEALAANPGDAELREAHDELAASIAEMEDALLHLAGPAPGTNSAAPDEARALGGAWACGPVQPALPALVCGSQCRFQYLDGQLYSGVVQEVYAAHAVVRFLAPTKSHMLDPASVPLSRVLAAAAAAGLAPSRAVAVGRRVLARLPGGRLWVQAVCEALTVERVSISVDQSGALHDLYPNQVVLAPSRGNGDSSEEDEEAAGGGQDGDRGRGGGGRRSMLDGGGQDDASTSGGGSDGGGSGSGDDGGGSEEAEEEEGTGSLWALGHARLAAAAGVQNSTIHFAEWESHSRGIASKLLAGMGYVRGRGLGRDGGGIVAPLEVQLLRLRRGLGDGPAHGTTKGRDGLIDGVRKKKRGGERSRLKRHKAAQAAHKHRRRGDALKQDKEHGAPGMFGFINKSLGDGSEAAAKMRAAEQASAPPPAGGSGGGGNGRGGNGRGVAAHHRPSAAPAGAAARRGLMTQQDVTGAIKAKVQQLKEMLERNKGNKGLAPQVSQALREAQAELARAEAQQAHASKAVLDGEAQKKWMKF